MDEFSIIERYFKPLDLNNELVGIGDDAAVVKIPESHHLVTTTDSMLGGVHFYPDDSAEHIGYKSLAVNLSDIAAMGATPKWATLSLSLPEFDHDWLVGFTQGFRSLAEQYTVALIGGDLSRGPLSITIQLQGLIPTKNSNESVALRRSGAVAGDIVYVTGRLGAAAFALQSLQKKIKAKPSDDELSRLYQPEPRIHTGLALRGLASSCIDISDGLYSELQHLCRASDVGCDINIKALPYTESLAHLDWQLAVELALSGGDDYELCFTLPRDTPNHSLDELNQICPITAIGNISASTGVRLCKHDSDQGDYYQLQTSPYRHFARLTRSRINVN